MIWPPAPEPAPAAFTCPVRLMSPSEVISTEPPLPLGAKALASTTPLMFTAAFTTWVATLAEIRTWPERACRVPVLLTPTRVPSDLIFSTASGGTTKLMRPSPLRSRVNLFVPASAIVPRSALMKPVFST